MPASHHDAHVRAWFGGDHASPALLVERFEEGFTRVWDRARPTLGDITLVAIADRVLNDVASRHPALAEVEVDASGLRRETLDALLQLDDRAALEDMLHEVLAELLTVVGRLTAEILTPALHEALEVEATEPRRERRARRDTPRPTAARASAEKDETS